MKTVVVTGFGPFGEHEVNASYAAVKELAKNNRDLGKVANLVAFEIPVSYQQVMTSVPKWWKEHKPDLTVHCGVSSIAKCLTLEKRAHNKNYNMPDVDGEILNSRCCVENGENCLDSELDLEEACDAVDSSSCGVKAELSMNAGRYLCEFIYYKSLSLKEGPVVFIHVPPLDKPYSLQQLAHALEVAILNLLNQISKKN